MVTTREQAEAYGYANRRMSTSLLRGTDEARLDPRRRLNRSLGGGVAIGILILASFGIAGWLGVGSGPDLPDDGAVVVGDTGEPYVVIDGTVHEALNLSSALLAGGGQLTEVREEKLNEAPHGLPIGIDGAPDAVPDAGDLLDGTWTLCARPAENVYEPTDTALYVSVPDVPTGGDGGDGGATLLVETEDGTQWLLTDGRRYAVDTAVRNRLGLPLEPVRLLSEVVDTVPEGPEIAVPDPVPGAGEEPSYQLPVDGALVGDIAETETDGDGDYYVVRRDGLAPVTELVHRVLSITSQNHQISVADLNGVPIVDGDPGNAAWPEEVPEAAELEQGQPVCVSTPPGSEPGDAPWRATVHLPDAMPPSEETAPIEADGGDARLGLLDQIYVPAGSGALVRVTASMGGDGTYKLVTDSGLIFPFSSADAVQRLGYDPAAALSMPRAYADLLPHGPVLDPEAATQEQRGEDR